MEHDLQHITDKNLTAGVRTPSIGAAHDARAKRVRFAHAMCSRFRRTRLRTQLLLVINASLAVVLGLMIVLDSWHGIDSRMDDKRVALSEEARTVASAIGALQEAGDASIQTYLDKTCALMNGDESPSHSITAKLQDKRFVATHSAHSNHESSSGNAMVAGTFAIDGIEVTIGESRTPIMGSAIRAGFRRLGAILIVGILAGVLLNTLLIDLVTQPLERLEESVRAIKHGAFGATVNAGSNAEMDGLAREITAMSHELDRRERGRQEQLARARRLQAHLMGASQTKNGMEICVEYHPADEIAGDFVDVITCTNGDLLVCLADVVGHGVHAAMEASVLKALLLSVAIDEASPASILETLNRKFYRVSLPEDFASMVILRITRDRRRVTFANAGHEPGCVRSASGEEQVISSTGLLLGVADDTHFDLGSIELGLGDVIILMSDGIPEARNAQDQFLGRKAIQEALDRTSPADARAAALVVLGAARAHRDAIPAHDDETVVAVSLAHITYDAEAGNLPMTHLETARVAECAENTHSSVRQERSDGNS